MNRIFCDRCHLEIPEHKEGIPLKLISAGVGADDEPISEVAVASEESDVELKLVFAVVDGDGEPADVDICTSCTQQLIEEYADQRDALGDGNSDED